MTKSETKQVLQKLHALYPHNYRGMSEEDKRILFGEWLKHFAAYSLEEVEKAVNKHIKLKGFNPTISEVVANLEIKKAGLWTGEKVYVCDKCRDTGFVIVTRNGKDTAFLCDCESGRVKAERYGLK